MYKRYLSSIKGIACLAIAFGHFLGILKYAESIEIQSRLIIFLNMIGAAFLVDESFWLNLFFLVSGYLLASSKIGSAKQFIVKCLSRFLRFAFPVFFACIVIFVLYRVIGFHNDETLNLFSNKWFQAAYQVDLTLPLLLCSAFDVLFLSKCWFNSPYWVLQMMFVASIVIYMFCYIRGKLEKLPLILIAEAALLVGTSIVYKNKTLFFCVVGAILFFHEKEIQIVLKARVVSLIVVIFGWLVSNLSIHLSALVLFSFCIVKIPETTFLKSFLEKPILDKIGKISFGIYSFHWPIFCSIGALFMIEFWETLGGNITFLLSVLVTYLVTISTSILYYFTAEKLSFQLNKQILKILEFNW